MAEFTSRGTMGDGLPDLLAFARLLLFIGEHDRGPGFIGVFGGCCSRPQGLGLAP